MTTISAQTILSSQHASDTGCRLTTLLLRYPRFIHAEMLTHRVFSRNSASSRAIPISKLIQSAIDEPVTPIWWGKNEPGMQAREQLDGDDLANAKARWEEARYSAIIHAKALAGTGLHKQIVNRVLEPFTHITVLVSSTQWVNFLALRDHPDAEPHIAALAREVRKELDKPAMQTLQTGDWHLPFITEEDKKEVCDYDDGEEMRRAAANPPVPAWRWYGLGQLRKLSAARCASTSYKTVDGFDMTLPRAMSIYDKLAGASPLHASPFEHVAQADMKYSNVNEWVMPAEHGNFEGFKQFRKMLPDECVK